MPTEKPRYCITVDEKMLKEIDDFRFSNRYNSRSQATLDLIRMGLEKLKEKMLAEQEHPNHSQIVQAVDGMDATEKNA